MAALLGDLNEAPRQEHSKVGVSPAHERFDAKKAASAQIDDRLILNKKLFIGERTSDVRLQTQSLVQQFLHLRLKGNKPVLARGLGVIHRNIGFAEQRFRTGLKCRERNSDAG